MLGARVIRMGHQQRERTPRSRSSRRLLEPAPDDARNGYWERRELEAMNQRFAKALTASEFAEASEKADPRPGGDRRKF